MVKSKEQLRDQISDLEWLVEHRRKRDATMSKKQPKETFIIVLPNGQQHAGQIDVDAFGNNNLRGLCEDAARRYDYKTSRRNPKEITCDVHKLVVENGNITQQPYTKIAIVPQTEELTRFEFEKEFNELVKQLPKAFHSFVEQESYDRGHSAGYEEVLSIAQDLVAGLKPAIAQYCEDSH